MISTHILDTSLGLTASAVSVQLSKFQNNDWIIVTEDKTNSDGRIVFNCEKKMGLYRLIFKIEEYFRMKSQPVFFPEVTVVFKIDEVDRKYHIPLLLSPYGYSTYRGS